jgi:hypothetical protein
MGHHKAPASEQNPLDRGRVGQPGQQRADFLLVEPRELRQPAPVTNQAAAQDGDRLGHESVGRAAQEIRESAIDRDVVGGVARLVKHGLDPTLARHDVRKDADIAAAIDVYAERMLALVCARIEIRGGEHRAETDVPPPKGL